MTRKPSRSRGAAATRTHTLSAVTSIRRLVRVLRLASQRTQTAAGVSAAQLFVLQQLGPESALSLSELAKRTLTDRSSVAAVVDRLHAQGFVERAVDLADRRRAAVRITTAGRRVLRKAPDAPTTTLIAALRTLDSRTLASLATSLRRLTEAVGASDEPPTMLFADDAAAGRRRRPRAPRSRAR